MKCVRIEYTDESYDLCDLEVEGGNNNYVAEGIVIHNTWACFGQYPGLNHPELLDGNTIVTSKGLSDKGLAFKFNEQNDRNLYIQAFKQQFINKDGQSSLNMVRVIMHGADILDADEAYTSPFYLLCEIFGTGVQDMTYGFRQPVIRLFDIYVGIPGKGRYLNTEEKNLVSCLLPIITVPILYSGPYSKDILLQLTDGKETVSAMNVHLREGVVVTPTVERRDQGIGRVKLKSVSADYLLRKNKNATEYT